MLASRFPEQEDVVAFYAARQKIHEQNPHSARVCRKVICFVTPENVTLSLIMFRPLKASKSSQTAKQDRNAE